MNFNLNSGYGQLEAFVAANVNPTFGRIFVVMASTAAGYDKVSEIFRPDSQGLIRLYNTIDAAVNACTANRGDVIVVAANYTETVSAAGGIDADVAGITIVGLGNSLDKPLITFATAAGADIDIDATDITIKNMRFQCNIVNQTSMIDINFGGCVIEDCHFNEGNTTGLNFITASAADTVIRRNKFHAPTAGNYNEAILLDTAVVDCYITDNYVWGDFDEACIQNPIGAILTNLNIHKNVLTNLQAGRFAIQLVSACTGTATDNRLSTNAQATAFDSGLMRSANNLWTSATADVEAGPVNPVVDVVTNMIGVDDANNEVATTNVVRNDDGSVLERLEGVLQLVSGVDSATTILGADDADNGFASTNVVTNDDGSIIERLEGLRDGVILARGTFTTSSATVPADTGRTEANDYWNGCLLIPTAGAIDNQARQIVDFANVGGVFTLDTDIPFTAVPGLVAYVIVSGPISVAPTADSTANMTVAHVVGRKTDAVIADTVEGAAATTQSNNAMLKSVLQRLGADSGNNSAATTLVAVNADGSVLERLEYVQDAELVGGVDAVTNVQMSDVVGNKTDAAIADTIEGAAATTQSLIADLKAVLQRIGADSANNTAATTLVTANRDGSLLERNEFLMDTLSGTAGIATFPAGVAAADTVSMAEVLRFVQENVVVGTGTVLPANTSLFGILAGASGVTTFPAAAVAADGVSLAEVLRYVQETGVGAQGDAAVQLSGTASAQAYLKGILDVLAGGTGIVTWPASQAPANGISMAEVLREQFDQQDKTVTNTTAVITTGGTIFTITNGPIEILSLVARCVAANGVGAQTLQWSADPTDGAAATFSGASADVASVAAGAMVVLQGTTLATAPLVATTGVTLGQQVTNGIVIGAGIITTTYTGGPSTGTWQHHLRYRPLSRGVVVS